MTDIARIYARFSTDQQRDTSIDDQLAADRALAARLRVPVDGVYVDRAVSGARRDRVEFLRMLADARAGKFNVLILWDLKRLSRGEDLPQLLATLKFIGVRIVTCDGYDSSQEGSDLRAWVEGMIGNRYVKDLAKAVHRGLLGQVGRNLSAGGMPYGYRPVTRELGQDLAIEPGEAEWVRWIYARYLEGWSPRRIAGELNRADAVEGKFAVPGPRGGTWAQAALYGHPRYRTGILRNPIYAGQYVWNRSQWIKDPETGKRHRRERPAAEWHTNARPDLAIVSQAQWEAVQARLARSVRPLHGRPPRTALSGLVRCSACGGPVVAVSQYDYGCAAHKDRGAAVCTGVRVKRRVLEEQLLAYARAKLLAPAELEALREDVAEILREDETEQTARLAAAHRRLAALEREVANLVQVAAEASWSRAIAERLRQAEAERERLQAELADEPAPGAAVVAMIPRLIERYRAMLESLPAKLARAPDEAREALRQCFGEIRLTNEGGHVYAELNAFGVILMMVAGDRFSRSNHSIYRNPVRFLVA